MVFIMTENVVAMKKDSIFGTVSWFLLAIGLLIGGIIFLPVGMITGIVHWDRTGNKWPFIANTVGLVITLYIISGY